MTEFWTAPAARSGYFRGGLPFNRVGRGPHLLVVFQGLTFENKPLSGLSASFMLRMYRFLGDDYTVYCVGRRPGLRRGCTMRDMSDDYAAMIAQEFGGPVDVIGISTGGSIVQYFAADHPHLVRRLVIHSSAHALEEEAKAAQLQVARLAVEGRWREAWAVIMGFVITDRGAMRVLGPPLKWVSSLLVSLDAPKDPSDLVATVEAEDAHAFRARLSEIMAPTLVVAGDRDPFYTPILFHQTAEGIPNARLILYEGMGHPAKGRQFERDVLAFLKGVADG